MMTIAYLRTWLAVHLLVLAIHICPEPGASRLAEAVDEAFPS